MRGFYWGSGVVRCGFCGMRHHNITTCRQVDRIATKAVQNIEKIPNYILSQDEYNALHEIKRRHERKASRAKPKPSRRKARCSFCGSTKHKRPKCDSLKDFKQLVYKANTNWKRLFTHRINECGLGIGSLVELKDDLVKSLSFNAESGGIVMITDYNLADLNVFCALKDYSPYQSDTTFRVMSGDWSENVGIKFLSNILNSDLLARGWWGDEKPPKVLSPMNWTPNEEWINSEWDEVLNWFFTNTKKETLEKTGMMAFLQEWADKI